MTPAIPCQLECQSETGVFDYHSTGAQILICGDLFARSADEPDFLKTAEL